MNSEFLLYHRVRRKKIGKYGIQPTFITTYGLARGAYVSSIQNPMVRDLFGGYLR